MRGIVLSAAAFFTAVEFGIQPMLFKDELGQALYCPYDLSIAIPAMMLPHLLMAAVLALNPEVLILDEPLAGLDAKSQMCFIELFRELKQAGKTIIAATHEDELQRQLGDKLLML